MKWLRVIIGVSVLWSSTAVAATLTWTANSESDLAGYRIYKCSLLPCGPGSGHQSLLATLGKVTSFNVGTPAVIQYYFLTAYDLSNNESLASNLVTFTPSSSTAVPQNIKSVTQTVVGDPATGPWGVTATTTDSRDVMTGVWLDGAFRVYDHYAAYSFPSDNGTTVTTAKYGVGWHTVSFLFYLEGTTTEIGRGAIVLKEGSQIPILKTLTLTVVGDPATGPWGVAASTTDPRDITATIRLDGQYHHVDPYAPYSFPSDNGITVGTAKYGVGWHTVEYIFYPQNSLVEIGRVRITVKENG
jgi:hypothetical protein